MLVKVSGKYISAYVAAKELTKARAEIKKLKVAVEDMDLLARALESNSDEIERLRTDNIILRDEIIDLREFNRLDEAEVERLRKENKQLRKALAK